MIYYLKILAIATLLVATSCSKNYYYHNTLGVIVASTLPYKEFVNFNPNKPSDTFSPNRSKWAPCDGRGIADSQYSKLTGKAFTPDLRGQFLRGAIVIYKNGEPQNYFNGSDLWHERDSINGYSYQKDSFKAHRHMSGSNTDQDWFGQGTPKGPETWATNWRADRPINLTSETGGSETRPKNMSVYYYIRINQ